MNEFRCTLFRVFDSVDEDGVVDRVPVQIVRILKAFDRSDAKLLFIKSIREDKRHRGLWWVKEWKKHPFKGISVKFIRRTL